MIIIEGRRKSSLHELVVLSVVSLIQKQLYKLLLCSTTPNWFFSEQINTYVIRKGHPMPAVHGGKLKCDVTIVVVVVVSSRDVFVCHVTCCVADIRECPMLRIKSRGLERKCRPEVKIKLNETKLNCKSLFSFPSYSRSCCWNFFFQCFVLKTVEIFFLNLFAVWLIFVNKFGKVKTEP